MIFGTKSKIRNLSLPNIVMGSDNIEYVKSYKYLGLTMDQTLTFNKHVKNLIRTLSHKTYQLSKIRHYLNEETSIRIYKTMTISYADYGDTIYDAAPIKQLEKLQKIQNRCLRICNSRQPATPVGELHAKYKVGTLTARRRSHLKNFM